MIKSTLYKLSIVTFLFSLLWISSCGLFRKNEVSESFQTFYSRFNEDMKFQRSRIDFPIDGYYEDVSGRHPWTAENWILHRAEVAAVNKSKYEVSVDKGKNKYTETIKARDGSLYFTRTFVKKGGRWYLISCVNIEE